MQSGLKRRDPNSTKTEWSGVSVGQTTPPKQRTVNIRRLQSDQLGSRTLDPNYPFKDEPKSARKRPVKQEWDKVSVRLAYEKEPFNVRNKKTENGTSPDNILASLSQTGSMGSFRPNKKIFRLSSQFLSSTISCLPGGKNPKEKAPKSARQSLKTASSIDFLPGTFVKVEQTEKPQGKCIKPPLERQEAPEKLGKKQIQVSYKQAFSSLSGGNTGLTASLGDRNPGKRKKRDQGYNDEFKSNLIID